MERLENCFLRLFNSQPGIDEDDLAHGVTNKDNDIYCAKEYSSLCEDVDIDEVESHFNAKFDFSDKHCDYLLSVIAHRVYC